MDLHDPIERACEGVPGLVRAVLTVLPEGLLIGRAGDASALDHEALIRTAIGCFGGRAPPALWGRAPSRFVEYLFVVDDFCVAIQGGRRSGRMALIAICTREPNLALILSSTRRALLELEDTLDLAAFGGSSG
jgi:hypothetical protein